MRISDWSSDVCSSDLRRTAGAQLDDQTIELKIGSDMRNRFGDKARINAMSYDGWVLLTGDIPTEQDKQEAETIAAKVQKVTKEIGRATTRERECLYV